MRIGRVCGTVTLNRCIPEFDGARLRLAQPLRLDQLPEGVDSDSEPLVLWDELGAGSGSLVAISEGSEAAQPFRPELKPVDAYNGALLDNIDLDASALRRFAKPKPT